MNRKGVTILELLISIVMTSVIVLLLIRVTFSFSKINNDESYASSDEIERAEIIKVIEKDFLSLDLKGINIFDNNDKTIVTFEFNDTKKELIIEDKSLIYDNTLYNLKSNKATYSRCLEYSYKTLDDNYYLVKLSIPVLIDNKNTTINDDITLTYLSLIDEKNNYLSSFKCSK
ncbi:MAG: hypothetical protein NC483_06320 [Ruminococcus sp.]|nr:hypothetical protein [Ruminococcus sp.]